MLALRAEPNTVSEPLCSGTTSVSAAWAQSPAVQRTFALVGEDDGTLTWKLNFLETLLAVSADDNMPNVHSLNMMRLAEQSGIEALSDVSHKMMRLATEWHDLAHRTRPQTWMPDGLLWQMIELQPATVVASYLCITVAELESYLWPATDRQALRAAAAAVMDGTLMPTAANTAFGLRNGVLAEYMRAYRLVRPEMAVAKDGRKFMSAETKARIIELSAEGLTPKGVQTQLAAEGVEVQYPAVQRVIKRAKSAPALSEAVA